MFPIAVALGLTLGSPRGGRHAHHAQIDVAMGGGHRCTTGVSDDPQRSGVASSSVMTVSWRATRPVEVSPVGWNHVIMAHARVGLDIAFASEGAR